MCLAETSAAVDEQWVVRLGGCLGHSERGGMGETVRGADHERVEGVLRVDAEPRLRRLLTHLRLSRFGFCGVLGDPKPHGAVAGDLRQRGADQTEEMTLDPLAREVVRNAEDELGVGDFGGVDLCKPGRKGVLVERLSEPTRNLVPDAFRSQLDWLFHPAGSLLGRSKRRASIAMHARALNAPSCRVLIR